MSYSNWGSGSRWYVYKVAAQNWLDNPLLVVADAEHNASPYSVLTLEDVEELYVALSMYLADVEEERRKAGWDANTVTEPNDGPKTEPTVSDVTERGHPTVKHTAANATTISHHPLRSIYTWEDVEATVRGQQSY